MSEPVSPIPTSQLFSKYRGTRTITTPTPLPPQPRNGGENSIADDDEEDYTIDYERQGGGESFRDYHEEDMMVELLERRRIMFARSNSLHPSTVRVSHIPLATVDAVADHDDEATSVYGRRDRFSGKKAASDKNSLVHNTHNNSKSSSARGFIAHIARELWSWPQTHWNKVSTGLGTLCENPTTAARLFSIHNMTIFVVNNEITITRCTLIGFGLFLVALILPCITRDPFGTRAPADPDSLLSYCNQLNIPGRPPVVPAVVVTGVRGGGGRGGGGRGGEGGGGSWRSSLRGRWNHTRIPTWFKSPIERSLSPTDTLDLSQSSDGFTNGGDESSFEELPERVLGVERSLSTMKVDLYLIQQQLRSTQWIDKILHIIRSELPAELVLETDPITGKMPVPIEFWEGIKDILVARGVLAEVVKEELTRQRDGKWDKFLVENEDRIMDLILDNSSNNNSTRRAVLSREEFLYLVATESNAIWTSLEGWVDSLVQRQLDQWKSEAADNERDTLSRSEQQILAEIIDRAVDRRYRQYRQPLLPNDDRSVFIMQPDYALYNSGGRIIPYLTTPDYHRYKPSTILGRFFKLQNWIPPPLTPGRERLTNRAIQVGMQAGDCWPMQGSHGQIAIRLARRVVVTAVTIEHVDPRISLDLGSAPREIEIWRLAAPLATSTASPSTFSFTLFPHSARMTREGEAGDEGKDGHERGESHILATWHKYESPLPGASLLTTITFQQPLKTYSGGGNVADVNGGHHGRESNKHSTASGTAQTFPIPLSRQNAPAYGVLVRVLSNWGHPDFTCLYRVHVHGYEV